MALFICIFFSIFANWCWTYLFFIFFVQLNFLKFEKSEKITNQKYLTWSSIDVHAVQLVICCHARVTQIYCVVLVDSFDQTL